jgi:enoyl-CoA hydratase
MTDTTDAARATSGTGASDAQDITVRRDGAVLTISLNRPHVLNAVTATVLADLGDLVEEAGADPDVRVVVLTGTGRAFSSGADLGGGPGAASDEPPGRETLYAANRLARALRALPKPVVAAVNGPAAGVGCSIALACDLVVASETAYFLLAFVNIGLMPDGGATALVPANVGRARAMEMALLGERIPAATAVDWGLIHTVVPAAELTAAVEALTTKLATGAPRALAASKQAVNEATLGQLDPALERELEGQGLLLSSPDFVEAVAAFGEKRTPRFTGA